MTDTNPAAGGNATQAAEHSVGKLEKNMENGHETLSAALACLVDYERWEGDMILCDDAWQDGMATYPTLNQDLWDDLMSIQARRNAVVRAARAAGLIPQAVQI